MIVNLRGTSGSGKTYVGRKLVSTFAGEPLFEPNFGRKVTAPVAYRLPEGMFVLGRYRDFIGTGEKRRPVAGGGCEGMKPAYIMDLLRHFAKEGDHVFFEGLTISASLHKWADIFDEVGKPHVIAYLDSTQQQCVDGVHTRNGGKEINEQAVFEHHDTVWSTKTRFEDLDHPTVWIPRQTSFESVLELYADNGWFPAARYLDAHEYESIAVHEEALEFERTKIRKARARQEAQKVKVA